MKKIILFLLCFAAVGCAGSKGIATERQSAKNEAEINSFLDDYLLWGVPLREIQTRPLYVIPDFFVDKSYGGYSFFYTPISDGYAGEELWSYEVAFVPSAYSGTILRITLNNQAGKLKPLKVTERYIPVDDRYKAQIPARGIVFSDQLDSLKKELISSARTFTGGNNIFEFDEETKTFREFNPPLGGKIKITGVIYGKYKHCYPQEDCYPYFVKISGGFGEKLIVYGEAFERAFRK